MIKYFLVATFLSAYYPGNYGISGEFDTYNECVSKAKKFFYASVRTDQYPWKGVVEDQLPGGLIFRWHCEAMVSK